MDLSPFNQEQIQTARDAVAAQKDHLSVICFNDDFGFASHVTHADKVAYSEGRKQFAEEIRNGEHDNNFTIRQKMYYELTGESIPFLPKESQTPARISDD